MKRILLCLLFVCVCVGCATKREAHDVYRVVEVHDTLRQEVLHTDSFYIRDSVRIWMEGDTIHHDRIRIEYRDRWRDRVQEVVRERTDTLTIHDLVIQKEKPTFWEKTKTCGIWIVGTIILILLSYLAVHFRRA